MDRTRRHPPRSAADPSPNLPQFAAVERSGTGTGVQDQHVHGSVQSQLAAVTVRDALTAMLAAVVDAEDELGRIDAVAGDGDHGVGMVRGLRAATAAASAAGSTAGAGEVLHAAGTAWADKAGGTSGVLWGAILTAIGDELGNTDAPTRNGVVRRSLPAPTHCTAWANARSATKPCTTR